MNATIERLEKDNAKLNDLLIKAILKINLKPGEIIKLNPEVYFMLNKNETAYDVFGKDTINDMNIIDFILYINENVSITYVHCFKDFQEVINNLVIQEK